MIDDSRQTYSLTSAESEYYRMWVFLKHLGIKPHEYELINPEDKLVLWRFIEYEAREKPT